MELLPNALGIRCGGERNTSEDASGMKEDGVPPMLCLESIRDIILCKKKKKNCILKNISISQMPFYPL